MVTMQDVRIFVCIPIFFLLTNGKQVGKKRTPLQRNMDELAKKLSILIWWDLFD